MLCDFRIMDIGEYLANIAALANTESEAEWVKLQ